MDREELRAAEAHIARLEEELLRLKDVKRDLQGLREEQRQLRRSAEGRAARLLTLPWRLFRRYRSGRGAPSAAFSAYEKWLARHRVPEGEIGSLRDRARSFASQPLVSILMPTFDSGERFLSSAIKSVLAQIYENWELIVVDDGSENENVRRVLQDHEKRDSRIHIFFEKQHRGISAALNTGLSKARGDWIGLADHDDLLEPDAVFRGIELLQTDPDADVIYSDEDKIIDGSFSAPMLKPDWSPELFLTHDYIGHFVLLRSELVGEGFCSEFDGSQDYELLLRVSEKTERIRHIPRVLYHWRRTLESTSHNIRRKPGALEAGRRAIDEHLVRTAAKARTSIDWETHTYRVRYGAIIPKVSVLLLGGDEETAAKLRARTADGNFELMFAGETGKLSGEYLVFLDENLEPIHSNWLSLMAEQMGNPLVGAVGARILNADDTIESAGYILMPDGRAQPAFAGLRRDAAGMNRQLKVVRNYSAVSASCFLTRTRLLETIAGNDIHVFLKGVREERVCAAVEYCLKLQDHGQRVISVPNAVLRRTTTSEQGGSVSCPAVAKRWSAVFQRDPFYNPNLSRERADFSLET